MNDSLFNTIFPSVEGCAKKIDEYLKDERAEYYHTSVNELIKFHDIDADDPDWLVKRCYTLLIAAISEMGCGIEKFWKRKKYNGRHSYPYCGQYVPITYFKEFCSEAAYA